MFNAANSLTLRGGSPSSLPSPSPRILPILTSSSAPRPLSHPLRVLPFPLFRSSRASRSSFFGQSLLCNFPPPPPSVPPLVRILETASLSSPSFQPPLQIYSNCPEKGIFPKVKKRERNVPFLVYEEEVKVSSYQRRKELDEERRRCVWNETRRNCIQPALDNAA